MNYNNRPTIYHQGDLRIIVPDHARQRTRERGEIQAFLPAIAALKAWDDIPVRQPVALKGETRPPNGIRRLKLRRPLRA